MANLSGCAHMKQHQIKRNVIAICHRQLAWNRDRGLPNRYYMCVCVCSCGSLIVVALSHIAAAASRVIGPNEMFSVHPVSVNNKVKCNQM